MGGVCAGLVFPNMDALSLCYLCASLCLFEFVCFVKTPPLLSAGKTGHFPAGTDQTRQPEPNIFNEIPVALCV